MLPGRVYRIFRRYAELHVAFGLKRVDLCDDNGTRLGWIDLAVRANRLILRSDIRADRLEMQLGTIREVASRGPDGFMLDVPLDLGPVQVVAETEQGQIRHRLRGVEAGRLRRARLALAWRFMCDLLWLTPQIYAWKWRGDLGAREWVKEGLGLIPRPEAQPVAPDLLTTPIAVSHPPTATLLMPIHNALDLLPEALDRILRHSGADWRLIVIEDASTDAALRPWLEAWCADPAYAARVTLIVNDRNLGFVGSVNRGLAHAAAHWPDDPVVLVNSDAMVPAGWLTRLLAPLADDAVASVTPMSNDAEIFTVPVICHRHDLTRGAGDALDAVAAGLNPASAMVDVPTGVGFCMAMAPRFLAQLPEFDPAFGKGYGEENDWCQKARALGGRNVGIGNLVVEHRGGASFGTVTKQRMLERNLAEISRRYPGYDATVQDFVRNDPMTGPRLALGLVWAAQQQTAPVPVFLAHMLGGGAEFDLARRIAVETGAGRSAVVLRVGRWVRWQVELHTPMGVTSGTTDETDLVVGLIGLLPVRRVVYSCGVGDADPVTLPDILLQLAGEPPDIEVLMHDYFPISPSYTLLEADGVYRGVPLAGQTHDTAHCAARPGGGQADLAQWQAAWGRLMTAATQITVFSEASRAIVSQVYPQARGALQVLPHASLQSPLPIPSAAQDVPVIGVLGNIGVHKGATVLARLSRDLARSGAARIVVLGQLDPGHSLASPSLVHGGYQWRDLPGLVARYRISAWLIPSIWPETFSFTTHEALATGMPVFAFDLGAQADAVRSAGNGHVLPTPVGDGMDIAPLLTVLAEVQDTGMPAQSVTE